jgi:hypothetical protein
VGLWQVLSGRQHPKRQFVMSHLVNTQRPSWQAWSVPQAVQTPPSVPQLTFSLPAWHAPSGSRHPRQAPDTQTPSSQRWFAAHVPQNAFEGPHASMPLFGAQVPSGRQHDVAHAHTMGPASTTPASTTGSASHFAAAQRSWLEHLTHASPPSPHSSFEVPSTHSVADAQQPSHVDELHGRVHPLSTNTITARLQRMCSAL